MPQRTRDDIRLASKVLRMEGMSVTLLTWPAGPTSTATPLSVVTANAVPSVASATKLTVYARVTWHKSAELTFDEGGRTTGRKANVEFSSEYAPQLKACMALIIPGDTTIYKKLSGNLGESQATYVLEVEGWFRATM